MALSEITNYIEDDWDDNALTSRTGATEGYFLHPSDNLLSGDYEAGDVLKGVYRPDWDIFDGSPSATNSELRLPDGSSGIHRLRTQTEFIVGSWKCDFQINSSTSTGAFTIQFISDTVEDNRLQILVNNSGSLKLGKYGPGITNTEFVNSSWGSDTNTHSTEAQRDSYGNFELFYNSVSQGTGQDNYLPDRKEIQFSNTLNARVDVDNLVVK